MFGQVTSYLSAEVKKPFTRPSKNSRMDSMYYLDCGENQKTTTQHWGKTNSFTIQAVILVNKAMIFSWADDIGQEHLSTVWCVCLRVCVWVGVWHISTYMLGLIILCGMVKVRGAGTGGEKLVKSLRLQGHSSRSSHQPEDPPWFLDFSAHIHGLCMMGDRDGLWGVNWLGGL